MSNKTFAPPLIDCNATAEFERQGYYQAPQLVPDDLLDKAVEHMDAVIAGNYGADLDPEHHFYRSVEPGAPIDKLVKINNAHVADPALLELISYPLIGEWATAVMGAKKVQVWVTQMLYKPTGGSATGNIGLHQDYNYWQFFETTEGLFTAWIAMSDITVESGVMRFVPGSHRWDLIDPGNFGEQDEEVAMAGIKVPEGEVWSEYPAVMPRGAVSFHHPMTFHGSGPNTSKEPRRSIAIHLCTEKSHLVEENPYISEENPVIYER